MEKESKIFGKGSDKPLSHYQIEINNAALALCKEDASLLKQRNELFNQAKLKIDQDGFRCKKRQSRSKVFGQGGVDDQQIQVTKRVKLSSEVRECRIEEVQSDIETDKDTIMLLEKEKQKCASMSKFGRAVEINEQISQHRKSMRGNQQILARLQKAEARSQKYHKDSADAKKAKRDKPKKKTPNYQATITDLLFTGVSSSQNETKDAANQSTVKESLMQQEVQQSSSLQQDLDDHTVFQRMPTVSVGSTLQNAMQKDVDQLNTAKKMPDHINIPQGTMPQVEDQQTVTQRLPATSSANTSQSALQESEEGIMIDTSEPVIQAKSDFQEFPQDR